MNYTLPIYVPRVSVGTLASVRAGSAIVGGHLPSADHQLYVDCEDGTKTNRRGTFADRCRLAAWRHLFGEPEASRLLVSVADVERVGRYDALMARVVLAGPRGASALASWLDVTEVGANELRTTPPGNWSAG
jgi:hypothetical protein